MRKYFIFLLFFITAIFLSNIVCPGSGYAVEDRSAKVDKYIKMINSNLITQRIGAAKLISRSGLSDPKLFNIIEKCLLKGYQFESKNPKHIDEMAWLCKALASSGISDYKKTLEKVANSATNAKLKRYARQSLGLIDEYAERNAIISDTRYAQEGQSPEATKYINMLKSDIISLKKDAAKIIFRSGLSDQKLFEVVNEELLKLYQLNIYDNNHVDAMAWLCKALGASGMSKYKETLEEIAYTTPNKKLKKYAKQALNMLP